jgi:hypothetical protein
VKAIGEVESDGDEHDEHQDESVMHTPLLASKTDPFVGKTRQLAYFCLRFHLRVTLIRISLARPPGARLEGEVHLESFVLLSPRQRDVSAEGPLTDLATIDPPCTSLLFVHNPQRAARQ